MENLLQPTLLPRVGETKKSFGLTWWDLAFSQDQRKLKKEIIQLKWADRNLFGVPLGVATHLTQGFPGGHLVMTSVQGSLPLPPPSRHRPPLRYQARFLV